VSAVEGEQIISAGGNAQRAVISSGSLEQVDGYDDNDFVFSGGTQQLNVGGTAIRRVVSTAEPGPAPGWSWRKTCCAAASFRKLG
jgi:autotransporter passenger strand-loop-strand repeat protein